MTYNNVFSGLAGSISAEPIAEELPSLLGNVVRQISNSNTGLIEIFQRLDQLAIRVFGEHPRPPQGIENAKPRAVGAQYDIQEGFEQNRAVINNIIELVSRLETIA